jgi:nucleoside-diphosphate-sugar epimerase
MTAELWAITGATGYLGRALRADLGASSIASRGLGRAGDAEIVADIRDRDAVRTLVRGANVVVHLAACVHQSARSGRAARDCVSVNVDGTQTVIDAVAAESPGAFLVFVSTANVYGGGAEPADEWSRLSPRTPYGRSKLEAEQRFLSAIGDQKIRGCVLRPAMIFGPGAPGNLARLLRMVRSGWVLEIAGGVQRKSIVPVSHAVAAIRAVARDRARCNAEVFNVAGETLTMHEIITALGTVRPPRIISVPRWIAAPALRAASFLAPSLAAAGETYMSDAVLRGDKLGLLTAFRPPESALEALRRLA